MNLVPVRTLGHCIVLSALLGQSLEHPQRTWSTLEYGTRGSQAFQGLTSHPRHRHMRCRGHWAGAETGDRTKSPTCSKFSWSAKPVCREEEAAPTSSSNSAFHASLPRTLLTSPNQTIQPVTSYHFSCARMINQAKKMG